MNYYDRQAKQLQQLAAMRMMLARQGQQAAGPMDIARSVASRGKSHWAYSTGPSTPAKVEHKKHGFAGFLDKIPWAIAPGTQLASEALDTSPGRAIIDLLSRGTYASANAQLETERMRLEGKDVDSMLGFGNMEHNERQLKAMWAGLTGKEKTTYSDVERFKDPTAGNLEVAGKGLAKDIFLDPTTYLPVAGAIGAIGKIGRASKVVKPLEVAVETASKGEPVASNQASMIEKLLNSQPNTLPKHTPIEITPSQVIDTAEMDKITGTLKNVPVRKYDDLDIPAPFKTVEEEVPATAGEKTEAQKDRLARARAIKATILQDESYKIGKYPVGQMLKAAQKNPETAKHVDKLINDHVKEVLKSGDTSALPERAQLYGRSGEKAAFGLDLDALTNLMRHGEVGGTAKYGEEGSDEFLKQFPLHDKDDLDNVVLNNARGEKVSLKQYVEELGVALKSVSQEGKSIAFGGVKFPEFNVPAKTVTAAKKTTKSVKYDNAAMINWAAAHQGKLDAEDLKRLHDAKTPAEYASILKEMAVATRAQEFKSIADFVAAAQGTNKVDPKWLASTLKQFGVKSPAELKAKVDKLLKGVKPKETTPGLVEGKVPVPNRVERILGPVAADDFGTPVKTAEELIDNGTTISYTLPKLTEDQLKDLSSALPKSVIENLVDPADVSKYPWMTDFKKAKRTSSTPGEGRARNIHGWHQYSQMAIFKDVMRSAAKRHPVPRNLKGKEAATAFKARSVALYDEIMPTLAAAETALRREGVKLITGTDNAGVMLSLSDVLQSLPRELVEKHLFNPRTSVLPTDFLQAGDNIVRALTGQIGYDVARSNIYNMFRTSAKIKAIKNAKYADNIATQLTESIVDNSDVILQRVEVNYARIGMETGKAVQSMTDDVIKNVVTKYADPNVSIGEALGDFAMRDSAISANGRAVKAPTEAYSAAKDMADVQLASVFKPGDFAESKSANDMLKATSETEAAKIGVKQSASRSAEALDSITPTVDLGDRFNAQLQGNLFRANVPLLDKVYSMQDALGRAFVASYGHEALHEALRVERSVTQDFSRMHRGLIAQLHDSIQKAVGPNAAAHTQEAFRHLQSGITPADPQMQLTMRGLQSSLDLTFGSSASGLGSFAQRNGIFPAHLNEVMDYYKVPKQYRFDTSKNWAEQADEWKRWEDVDDPLSVLDGVHASMQRASVEVSLGRDFSQQFGSTSPQPGYVKIKNSGNKSKIARFIDQDRYYPAHIAEQMTYLDKVLDGSLGRIKNPNAAETIRAYDSIIHAWKSGLTIYRPGHHIRNLIGDVTLSFFDGVTNPNVYYKANRILSGRSKAYEGWDGLKALQEGTQHPGVASGSERIRVKIGGKKKSFTDDQIWRAAFDQGIIPDYRTLEDIAFNNAQGMGAKSNKVSVMRPLGGRGQKLAGGLSQSRDHWVRIAHFVDVLEKGHFKNLEEAFGTAGQRVRKWHPDGSDLTNFENKVARRTFMFYSWMRKAIPLVVETLVMRPGRAMVFPKTMYAFAEANGVDLDSLGNPFPVDQLFPEFITDQVIGPQFGEAGDYGGINPGEPITEMLSQWGSSDPQHGLGGSLSPVARIPIELYTNKNLGTGSEIQDKTDYVDSQIPGLGYLSKITGHSVTGLGQPTSDINRGLEEPGFNDQALVNFLTGIGVRDYSKKNYIKRAQLEKRDEYRRGNG